MNDFNQKFAQPVFVAQQPAKSWVAAFLLCFFLGSLGIHNFYLGYTTKGIIQLAMNIVGWATSVFLIGFLILVPLWIWVFVEFILILMRSGNYGKDANGVPLN